MGQKWLNTIQLKHAYTNDLHFFKLGSLYDFTKGVIGAHSLFIVEELYASYEKLDGNSFIYRQIEDIRELQVRSAQIDLK